MAQNQSNLVGVLSGLTYCVEKLSNRLQNVDITQFQVWATDTAIPSGTRYDDSSLSAVNKYVPTEYLSCTTYSQISAGMTEIFTLRTYDVAKGKNADIVVDWR